MEITLDTKPFEAALSVFSERTLPGAINRGVYKWGEHVMGRIKSGPEVPVMDGALRASGVVLPVTQNGNVHELKMGFGNAAVRYAVKVHENPRSGKTGGVSPRGKRYKKWAKVGAYKYLERPMAEDGPKVPEFVAREVA